MSLAFQSLGSITMFRQPTTYQRWLKNNNQFFGCCISIRAGRDSVLFCQIAFTFHQIYPQSRSHARLPNENNESRMAKVHCKAMQWQHYQSKKQSLTDLQLGTHTHTREKNVKSGRWTSKLQFKSSTCFDFHVVIFKRDAENPLFTMYSSTSLTEWY